MNTIKSVNEVLDKEIKVMEDRKKLLILTKNLYKAISECKELEGYEICLQDVPGNIYSAIEIWYKNLRRVLVEPSITSIEVSRCTFFESSNYLSNKRKIIEWVNSETTTEEVLETIKSYL